MTDVWDDEDSQRQVAELPMPAAFKRIPLGGAAEKIEHRRSGMGCMTAFMVVWLSGWTLGCVLMIYRYSAGPAMPTDKPLPLAVVVLFCASDVAVGSFFLYMICSRKTYSLESDTLTMETELFGYRWRKAMEKKAIQRLVQVRDGGRGRDSFPSWGLNLEGVNGKMALIFRQPYEHSQWLGRVIALWAGVEFIELPESDKSTRGKTV